LNLLSTLKPPKSLKPANNSAVSLGKPGSDIDNNEPVSPKRKAATIETLSKNGQPGKYTFANVLPIIAAVCLAHFLLVISGFTGTAWLEKLKSMVLLV